MHGSSQPSSATTERASRRARRVRGAIVLSCALALGLAAVATAALPWRAAEEVALPANASSGSPDASLSLLSCPTAGACVGAGLYGDTDGTGRTLVAAQSGGSWAAARELTLPAGAATDPQATPTALACATASDCALTGAYQDASDGLQAMVATRSGGTWGAAQRLDLPANADATDPTPMLTSVACPAPGACTAVGYYFTSADHPRAMVATRSGASWSDATELDLPADADATTPDAGLYAVACGTAGSCAAVGSYLDDDGAHQAMIATATGGTWSAATKVDLPAGAATDPLAYLNAVACPAAGSCTALGSYVDATSGGQVMSTSLSGTATRLSLPANAHGGDPDAAIAAVACASATSCAAVGSYFDASDTPRPMVASRTAGAWAPATQAALPADADATSPGAHLDAVACPAPGACVAAGSYVVDGAALRPMVAAQAGAAWATASALTAPGNADADDPEGHVYGLACGSDESCVLGGDYTTAAGERRAMVAAARPADPATPVATPTPDPVVTPTPSPTRTTTTSTRPALTLKTKKLTVAKGAVKLKLACTSARCAGTIRLTRAGKVLATASYAIPRGATQTITIRLTKAGKKALRNSRRRAVKVKVVVAVKGAGSTAKSLLVR